MLHRAAIAVVLVCLAAPLRAGEPEERTPASATAVATPDKVRLGDSFTLTIEIHDASDVRYELPAELSLGKEFEIVKVTPSRATHGAETVTRFDVQVTMFDLGEKSLGDVVLSANGPGGASRLTVHAPKVTCVGDMKEDEQGDLSEILPPVDVMVPRYTLLWIVGATILATLAVLLLWRWLKGRPRRVKPVFVAPRAPAHERALAALEALQREDLPGQSRHKEFHFRLSEILRDYLGERFGFLALDMTTEELLATLERTSTPGLQYARFEAWCREGDLVKYARLPATGISCKQAIEDAFGFVHSTLPRASGPAARPSPAAQTGASP
jgi:hypothetical protein